MVSKAFFPYYGLRSSLALGLVSASLLVATSLWAQDNELGVADDAGSAMVSDTQAAPAEATNPAFGKFPRYASLKKAEVNVRSGPGNQYPILWVYQRPGYPVQLLARYDNYYKVRDVEGEEGWVFVGMASAKLTGLVTGKVSVPLRRHEAPDAVAVAKLAPGVVVELLECNTAAVNKSCKVEVNGYKGWVNKNQLDMVE